MNEPFPAQASRVLLRSARAAAGGARRETGVLQPNTDVFYIPSEEEVHEQELRQDAQIALSIAGLTLLGADVLWLILGVALLQDFRPVVLAFVAADLAIVWLSRKMNLAGRAALIVRGLAGVAWFSVEAVLFGAPWSMPAGQALLLVALLVLIVGRGGEGRVTAGLVVAVVSVVMTFAVGFVMKAEARADLNRSIEGAFELASVGRIAEAVDALNGLLEANADDAWVHMAAAEFFIMDEIRMLDRALEMARRAVELAPGDLQTQAHLVLTRVLVARGEFADAVAALDAAVKKDGDNPLVHLLRARILTNLGRKQEAIEDYRRVEKLAPDTDVGQAARLERLQIEGPGTGRITSPAS